MASTSCPRCGAWTVGFEYDLTTGEIVWYCLACGHHWRRDEDERPMNVPKMALYGAGTCIGLLGLGVLIAAVAVDQALKRRGWGPITCA